jgi:PPOX class probable F420-dependent enzyme
MAGMDLDQALRFAAAHSRGVLITIRRDGRPQSSTIAYSLSGATARISVTDDRAKTKNLLRDPRAVLHVNSDDQWSYVALDGTAVVTPVTRTPGDEVGRELAEVYEAVAGKPHPNWDEFYAAMVTDRRRVVRFTATSATGVAR